MDDAVEEAQQAGAAALPLRLTIELVPASAWGHNLRQALPRPAWEQLRARVLAAAGHRCAICGAGGQLHCHEVWQYDDERHIQRLAGCIALCRLCHAVKHLGRAELVASQGGPDEARLIAHFRRVNGCDRATYTAHRAAAFAQWQARSRHEWTLEFGME